MKLKHKLLATGFMALATSGIFAQDAAKQTSGSAPVKELDRWSVGVNVGTLLFYGETRQYDFYPVTTYENEWGLGYGLTLNRSFGHAFSLQGQLLNGSIAGTKREAGYYFNADVFEMSLNGIINISNLTLSQRAKQRKWSLYGLIGVGLTSFKSQLFALDTKAELGGYGVDAEGAGANRTTETVIPVGLGLKYKLSSKMDLGLEHTIRNVNSDKLDSKINEGSAKDKYSYTALGLTYKFGDFADRNEWVNPLDALIADNNTIKAKIEGLTNDSDKDGVADVFDKDNATPDGAKVYGDGTAVDTDGDGVVDAQDADPFTNKGAKVDSKGREADSDGDGVVDSRDMEPNTKSGALVNFQGKAINVEAAPAAEVSTTGYLPSVYFQSGSANIQFKYYESLAAVAKVLKSNPSIKLTIVGHADATGSDKANEKLSQRRAEAVAKHLNKVYGIDNSRLNVQAKGRNEIFATGNDAMNRRVDFKVSK